jgi:CRP-like cAMP-binding protein
MPPLPGPRRTGNRFLDRLPAAARAALAAALEPVDLRAGDELLTAGGPLPHVYFPAGGLVSVLAETADGGEAEAAAVGREGLVGVAALLGATVGPVRAAVQVAGPALRADAAAVLRVGRRVPAADRRFRRYAAYTLRAVAQTAVCAAAHPLRARVCRWLAAARAKTGRDEVPITQEALAVLLAAHRPTVTQVARTLQEAGLIAYRRGTIRVTDPAGLEAAACGCQRVIDAWYARMLNSE